MNTVYDDLIRFAPDGFIHDNQRLAELQALPLHRKIGITIARITEWYNHFNGNVYVSISGGKDSTVLWDIVHKLFPKDFNLTLMPESSDCENVAISLRICPDQFPVDTQKGSLAYDRLEYSIGDLLISYIQNIIRRTSNE